jgi:methylase of polypeptide subunit release factors
VSVSKGRRTAMRSAPTAIVVKKGPAPDSRTTPFSYIDLFCGCGGFSLGLERAGLTCLAAIDHDPAAINAFKANIPDVQGDAAVGPTIACDKGRYHP